MTQAEIWMHKKRVEQLAKAKGDGTSMITLLIKPGDAIHQAQTLLLQEYGTAVNIKSRVNRASVQQAITSCQSRLKLYKTVPPNGLCVFCGNVIDEGQQKHLTLSFEPPRPLKSGLYLCDNRFHVEALEEILQVDNKYGVVIVSGTEVVFGVLNGQSREVLHTFSVDLPKKHGRGGQSAVRFARLRLEKRHAYLVKVAEGIILAGPAGIDQHSDLMGSVGEWGVGMDLKNELRDGDLLDPRIKKAVVATLDTAYGGRGGFDEAVELAGEILQGLEMTMDQEVLKQIFTEIGNSDSRSSRSSSSSQNDLDTSLASLRSQLTPQGKQLLNDYDDDDDDGGGGGGGDNDDILWLVFEGEGGQTFVKYGYYEDQKDIGKAKFQEGKLLVEYLADHCEELGIKLRIITDQTPEGRQLCQGFGGVGALLRYPTTVNETLVDGTRMTPCDKAMVELKPGSKSEETTVNKKEVQSPNASHDRLKKSRSRKRTDPDDTDTTWIWD
eukprot:jgi/Bigna1/131017/aug1.13_g5725